MTLEETQCEELNVMTKKENTTGCTNCVLDFKQRKLVYHQGKVQYWNGPNFRQVKNVRSTKKIPF